MPTYIFKCDKCKIEDEWILPYEECDKEIICECGGTIKRVFSVPYISIPNPVSEARRGRGQG